MKGALGLRPVFHYREDRIRAHIQLCWLALTGSSFGDPCATHSSLKRCFVQFRPPWRLGSGHRPVLTWDDGRNDDLELEVAVDPSQLDGVSVIVGALAAGAGDGLKDVAKGAVTGAAYSVGQGLQAARDNSLAC